MKKLGKFYCGLTGLDVLACPACTRQEFRPADYKRPFWPRVYDNYLTLMLSARQQRRNQCGGNVFYWCARSLRADHLSSLSVFHRRCCRGCGDCEHQREAHAATTCRCVQVSPWLLFGARWKKMCSTRRRRGCWKLFVSGRQGRRRRCPFSVLRVRTPGGWETG